MLRIGQKGTFRTGTFRTYNRSTGCAQASVTPGRGIASTIVIFSVASAGLFQPLSYGTWRRMSGLPNPRPRG
jgi:hypothetical protein